MARSENCRAWRVLRPPATVAEGRHESDDADEECGGEHQGARSRLGAAGRASWRGRPSAAPPLIASAARWKKPQSEHDEERSDRDGERQRLGAGDVREHDHGAHLSRLR